MGQSWPWKLSEQVVILLQPRASVSDHSSLILVTSTQSDIATISHCCVVSKEKERLCNNRKNGW